MYQDEQNYRQDQPYSAIRKTIETKVAGVTFEGRQRVVASLQVGEPVVLTREPENRYDANAIRVERVDGAQIGYIPREIAGRIAPFMDEDGEPLHGTVSYLTGSSCYGYSLGVVIRFQLP